MLPLKFNFSPRNIIDKIAETTTLIAPNGVTIMAGENAKNLS
jgi:hypothetical protein